MALALSTAILRLRVELRTRVDAWKRAGERIGVVPTMGALHEGHLALVRAALTQADRVVVTLFVNPRQFNSAEDLAAYPRTERADAAILSPLGADVLYVPDVDQIYPPGFATTVHVAGLGDDLCGAFRPGHFDGVATVVPKLLLQTGADLAFFGEKDFQQITIVRRLVADLDIPCEIVPVPTVRETDGLALSSRNVRLAPADRAAASALFSALSHAAAALRTGVLAEPAIAAARAEIEAAGFERVEYVELRRASDLAPLDALRAPARLLAAAWLGGVRLIDNIPVDPA